MKTAKEILHEKATENNDGFLSGQVKWIIEAMEEYAELVSETNDSIWKREYDLAVKEISDLQKQLKDAEQEIRDLSNASIINNMKQRNNYRDIEDLTKEEMGRLDHLERMVEDYREHEYLKEGNKGSTMGIS